MDLTSFAACAERCFARTFAFPTAVERHKHHLKINGEYRIDEIEEQGIKFFVLSWSGKQPGEELVYPVSLWENMLFHLSQDIARNYVEHLMMENK